jgi:hypothetical protein
MSTHATFYHGRNDHPRSDQREFGPDPLLESVRWMSQDNER